MTDLRKLQAEAWAIAEDHGFHEPDTELCPRCEDFEFVNPRSRAKVLALIHSEVSEALEADREGDDELYAEELADIVIRVMDHAETEGIDLEEEIKRKNAQNEKREHKHGKEY